MLLAIQKRLQDLKVFFQKSWKWRAGYILIGGFVAARWLGVFSTLELVTLDFFLHHRPPEDKDEHVVIILADRSPISSREMLDDAQIARLLEIVFSADPAVVGLNIFRKEFSIDQGRARLIELFETHSNLIGVEKILPPREISPIANLSKTIAHTQFGINDIPIDKDGRIRRVFVGAYTSEERLVSSSSVHPFKFAFSFKVARQYLEGLGYQVGNSPSDLDVPIFIEEETQRHTRIPILRETYGGYIRDRSIAKVQTLLNFRSGRDTFEIIDAEAILASENAPTSLTGKAVIIGSIDYFFPNFLAVAASSNSIPEESEAQEILSRLGIIGAELEAHSTSQIINAVLENRPLIQAVHPLLADSLIILVGVAGILIGNTFKSILRNALMLIFSTVLLLGIGYGLLYYFGIWVPVVPACLLFFVTGIIYTGFYQSERLALIESQKLENERRKTIEQTFNAIHAGPLQTLASLLRTARDGNINPTHLIADLQSLNTEIRGIGERLRQEAIGDVYFVDVRRRTKLDLTHPMHEVFYEIYNLCLQKELPGFTTIKVRSVTFEPFACQDLALELKRNLCWVLQESLENVGKHAVGTTRLLVTGKLVDAAYTLRIEDNGPGITSTHRGEGTRLFYQLEEHLKGKFSRTSKPTGGTICQFTWPL